MTFDVRYERPKTNTFDHLFHFILRDNETIVLSNNKIINHQSIRLKDNGFGGHMIGHQSSVRRELNSDTENDR